MRDYDCKQVKINLWVKQGATQCYQAFLVFFLSFQNAKELDTVTKTKNQAVYTLSDSRSQLDVTHSDDAQRQVRRATDELLNTSYSLRFQLQAMESGRKHDKPGPFSTAYPLL